MFRLIRWMCFPIARQFRVWPLAVYYALALVLIAVRWAFFPPSDEMLVYMPDGIYPVIYLVMLVVIPVVLVARNRGWIRVPDRT